jgi:hypothetical protein
MYDGDEDLEQRIVWATRRRVCPGAIGRLREDPMNRKRMWLLVAFAAGLGVLLAVVQKRRTPAPATVDADDPASQTANERSDTPLGRGGRASSVPPRFDTERRPRRPSAYKLWASGKVMPEDGYNAEDRDPVWAPAMEASLESRFRSSLPPWLQKISVSDVECRTSACRAVLTYPSSLVTAASERAIAEGLPSKLLPLDYVMLDTGPLAHGSTVLETENLQDPDGEPHVRITAVWFFDRDEVAPATYAKWVETNRYNVEQTRKRMIEAVRSANPGTATQ